MGVLQVVLYPDVPLTKKALPVDTFDGALARLADDMLETMDAYQGVGLAGPQVGQSKRIFVLREPEGPEMCLVNPEIELSDDREEGEEGCLSVPHIFAMVRRAIVVNVKARGVRGELLEFEAQDFLARIIQHEYDHLDGIFFPQRLDLITRQEKLEEWQEVRKQILAEPAESPIPQSEAAES
ncbi:MAG: peptide deformylase [Candidatus Hydrogenedentes bacterium]|nr:peptide deformylase [Candidatus Hydrogenedentota bacterium]